MKHRVAKRKFGYGYDANKMLMRQLCRNFFLEQKVTTTKERAKAMQIAVEKLVSKAKSKTEANKNHILHFFGEVALVDRLFKTVGPAFENINGGYTKMTLLKQRQSDGAIMAQITWAHPLQKKEVKPEIK
ncbi:50S ribosomal protein L17 [Candidatus Roizmanbacteria bacterium CG11_big_fil_rev_8_21_14_0_20_37_16]|uniref:50S ribosomal protein L17 n=1 Tax=Candidatus Roizmanbacteria bacterium CG11_big_fil_rev_8_21_14_0_20_37_16 TaxID=1974857 RepID=A0A2H0KKU1_9BACT|nr:MAG: 50S ribosomal protein L17 [Candidatus Roizmanbacteria bacterium CG11_big_fil_rev_8_21_14_0_20_37_16]